MAACERCWAEAGLRAEGDGRPQNDHYREVVREREQAGLECSPAEQCGEVHALHQWLGVWARCACGERTEVGE